MRRHPQHERGLQRPLVASLAAVAGDRRPRCGRRRRRGGADASNVAIGDRVYVNPLLSCGACHYCRYETPMLCSSAAFQGYFGFFPESVKLIEAYPYGGFGEYMTAEPQRLVKLPNEVTFDQAARFGYLGTSFSGLRFGGVGAGSWVGINGITGTLGVGATLLALAMGATRILGFGRNRDGAGAAQGARTRADRYDGARRPPDRPTGCASAPTVLASMSCSIAPVAPRRRARRWTRSEASSGAASPSTSARYRSRCRSTPCGS